MGVINGRDLLSSKYPTAIIIDAVNTAHFVPITHPIGDYFFVIVNEELYAFDTKGDAFKWRQKAAKTFEFQIFFTDHYKPITSHIKELELMIEKNGLPKVSIQMYKLLQLLKLREKKKFENFKISKLIEELHEDKDTDPKRYGQYKDVINYLRDLGIDEIVTPVRRVSSYLEESFMATDAKFMGSVKTAVAAAMTENREVNHQPISSKKGWMKIALLMMLVLVIGLVVYLAYSGGAFDSIGAMIPDISDVKFTTTPPRLGDYEKPIDQRYASPGEAKLAIERGEVKLSDFPPEMRPLIESAKVGAIPNP